MKKLLVLIVVLGAILGTTWNAGFELVPDGSTALASDIDTFIKDFKLEVRNRASVETIFGTGSDDNGLQRVGSARVFIQNGAPTDLVGPGQYNSHSGSFGGTTLSTEELGASTDDLGRGRIWVDLDGPDGIAGTPDDRAIATWDETNNIWKYDDIANTDATTVLAQRFLFDPGKFNLLYNGFFAATDGTGALAASAVPAGWAFVATNPTITYTTPLSSTTDGVGVQVNLARAAGDGGIEQTLTSLDSDSTYYVEARARATGGATCELSTSAAGGTNLAAQTTTAGSLTTLSGVFTTTAGAVDTLTVRLRVLTAGTCNFSQVAVYKTSNDRRGLTSAGTVAVYRSITSTGALPVALTDVDGTNLRADFTPPGPGWIVEVDSEIAFTATGGNSVVTCLLDLNGSSIGGTIHAIEMNFNAPALLTSTLHLRHVNINPTPGTTLTYKPRCISSSANGTYDGTSNGLTLASNISLVAHPSR